MYCLSGDDSNKLCFVWVRLILQCLDAFGLISIWISSSVAKLQLLLS